MSETWEGCGVREQAAGRGWKEQDLDMGCRSAGHTGPCFHLDSLSLLLSSCQDCRLSAKQT